MIMQISEPTTLITDYLLGALNLYLAARLWKTGKSKNSQSIKLWSGAFLASAIAAVVGGTSHGFAFYLSDFADSIIWKTTIYSIGLASFFMLAGTITATLTNPLKKWLLMLTGIKFLLFALWMMTHSAFKYVIYDYGPAMVGVMLLLIYAYLRKKEKGAPYIITGILISFFAAGIQQAGLTIHKYFNHNDLYHVIQMGAMIFLYKGARKLKDQR